MRSFDEQRDFQALLVADPEVAAVLSKEALDRAFDVDVHLRHVDAVIDRALGAGVPVAEVTVR